mmetsp:Transcript_51594/g.120790  ORF Transcript_51594/g.120790 Transcript_51594/m.120790 type:complete len:217 (-) Transcript_51594:189-839(-)
MMARVIGGGVDCSQADILHTNVHNQLIRNSQARKPTSPILDCAEQQGVIAPAASDVRGCQSRQYFHYRRSNQVSLPVAELNSPPWVQAFMRLHEVVVSTKLRRSEYIQTICCSQITQGNDVHWWPPRDIQCNIICHEVRICGCLQPCRWYESGVVHEYAGSHFDLTARRHIWQFHGRIPNKNETIEVLGSKLLVESMKGCTQTLRSIFLSMPQDNH